ncbi:MAG: radical SAM protein [Deltaproteobacteria bacterium]|nr:MAG: radical SAM protein [Deltaproteobacteria bacterium]TMQ07874.1 MAG: radical SAM protein [Deltaproteobacteria bacterium]
MTPEDLARAVPEVSLAEARKIVAAVHRGEPIAASSAVRRDAARAATAAGQVPALAVLAETASAIDPCVKYLVAAPDGARFEAVRIPLEHPARVTVCVSSQVGCALACAFCATGRLGLARNLAAWEIVEQVRIVRAHLAGPARSSAAGPEATGPRVHGVVFQGMGEPLANLDAVVQAIRVFSEPCALGIDARAITVCTAGLPSGIRRLAAEAPRVRLGISIASAIPAHRRSVMPIAERHDLDDVLAAAADHARATGLSPMWAVTLLDGVNDGDGDARALADRALAFHAATGIRPRISLLDYNAIGDRDPFARSPRMPAFRAILSAAGLPSHRRYSGGSDVAAACGQLASTGAL